MVEDSAVVSIIVETIDKMFVFNGLGGAGSLDKWFLGGGQWCGVDRSVVELPEDGIEALGGVVSWSWIGRVKNVGFASSWKGDINVTLGNFSSRGSVSIDTHGSKMDNVGIDIGVNDSAAKVVGSADIVVNGVTLGFGVFHGVGSGTLFGKVHDGVGLFVLDELDEEVVLFGDIEVDEFNVFSGNFLPCLDTNLLMIVLEWGEKMLDGYGELLLSETAFCPG